MPRYLKKPVEVEAVLYTGDLVSAVEVDRMLRRTGHRLWPNASLRGEIWVFTVDGNVVAVPPNAYVVIDSKGYPYPCDREVFEFNHERVE